MTQAVEKTGSCTCHGYKQEGVEASQTREMYAAKGCIMEACSGLANSSAGRGSPHEGRPGTSTTHMMLIPIVTPLIITLLLLVHTKISYSNVIILNE